jgi:uncharacterized protein (DUF1778 family)
MTKGRRVQLYVPADALRRIDEAAAVVGEARSEFMVRAALERAQALDLPTAEALLQEALEKFEAETRLLADRRSLRKPVP